MCEQARERSDLRRIGAGERLHEPRELGDRHAAIDGDAFHAGVLQPAHQLAHVLGGARHRDIANHQVVADDADRERGGDWRESAASASASVVTLAHDEWMARSVQLGTPNRRRKAADEIVGDAGARTASIRPIPRPTPRTGCAAFRTP